MPKKHKVLMLVENMSVPADPRVWHEACTLYQSGYHVSVICPKGQSRNREPYICLDGIHIYRYDVPASTNKSSDYIKEFAVAMLRTLGLSYVVWRQQGFDVIHAANPPDLFFTIGLLYRLLGKKYIFDQHDLAPEVFRAKFQGRMKPLYHLLQFFELASYQIANAVITTNESQKQMALNRGHCPPDKVYIVRNGPDIDTFKVMQPEPELKRGKRYLLAYIGVMGAQDGVDIALTVLHDLVHKRGRQDVGLVLMGTGEQEAELQALAHNLNLDDYVNFTGWLDRKDLLRYLTVTDIGISPDPSNALNDCCTMLKTMEYMAMGKPVVAFDLPETHYSAQDAALYATPNRCTEFADKIEILLDNAELRQQMGASGRKRIEEELCWERTKINLWRAYQRLFPDQPSMLPEVEAKETQTKDTITSAI
jgi:glycosyltransferase involved in cell wall biosynthesis